MIYMAEPYIQDLYMTKNIISTPQVSNLVISSTRSPSHDACHSVSMLIHQMPLTQVQNLTQAQSHLAQQLQSLCEILQAKINRNTARYLRLLQQESGLTLPTQMQCPQTVLLIPPKAFKRLYSVDFDTSSSSSSHSQLDHIYTAKGQAYEIAHRLDDEHARNASRLLERFIEKLDRKKIDSSLISQLMHELNKSGIYDQFHPRELFPYDEMSPRTHEINREYPKMKHQTDDVLATYHHNPPHCFMIDDVLYSSHDASYKLHPHDYLKLIQHIQPHIRYYALRILRTAVELEFSTKHLCSVVQIHELSHLITHLGLDAAHEFWYRFSHASKMVKEGTAQDLTYRMIQTMIHQCMFDQKRISTPQSLLHVFKTLAHMQAKPYTIHQQWIRDIKNPNHRRLGFQLFRVKVTADSQQDLEQDMHRCHTS